ncbi:MAG: hypothetical protein EOO99_08635 [Pedobacter sp.]|nr:MAG: hypothetical protein EOO99_08635 [Pedobacter sp.]
MTQKQIAKAFSHGNFSLIYTYLSEDIRWEIIGEKTYSGIKEVKSQCEKVTSYFLSVQTEFVTEYIFQEQNLVLLRAPQNLDEITRLLARQASDIYLFDDQNQIQGIKSFCITHT